MVNPIEHYQAVQAMGEFDNVNRPSHYASGDIECIDAIRAQMSHEEYQGYLRGNVVKYMWRWRDKGGVESLRKAEWYLRKLIESETRIKPARNSD